MENAKNIWTDYKSGKITEKQAVNLLLELLFRKKYEFGLASFDDDSFSDFIVFMNNRFETILRKYNPDISDFKTYLHSVINLTAFWWKKKLQETRIDNFCCQSMCVEENLSSVDFSPVEKDFYVEEPSPENLIPVSVLAEEAMKNLNIRMEKNKTITSKRAKEIVKVLALKSCNNITEQQIEIVAEITGISIAELRKMISQAEETLKLKKDRIAILQNKRNFAYFQKKRKNLKRAVAKDTFPQFHDEAQTQKDNEKWQKASQDLSEAASVLVPSNKIIGELLNMSCRKVKTLMDEAKENFTEECIVNTTFE